MEDRHCESCDKALPASYIKDDGMCAPCSSDAKLQNRIATLKREKAELEAKIRAEKRRADMESDSKHKLIAACKTWESKYSELEAERDAALAVVEKLPKDKNGKAIAPGDVITDGRHVRTIPGLHRNGLITATPGGLPLDPKDCELFGTSTKALPNAKDVFTREAAEASQEGAG